MSKLLHAAIILIAVLAGQICDAQVVRGKVTDSDGLPLPGCTILNGTNGVFSDSEGSYELKFDKAGSYDISFSFVGFNTIKKPVTLAAGQTANLNVTLESHTERMGEVVVVGNGCQRKR